MLQFPKCNSAPARNIFSKVMHQTHEKIRVCRKLKLSYSLVFKGKLLKNDNFSFPIISSHINYVCIHHHYMAVHGNLIFNKRDLEPTDFVESLDFKSEG